MFKGENGVNVFDMAPGDTEPKKFHHYLFRMEDKRVEEMCSIGLCASEFDEPVLFKHSLRSTVQQPLHYEDYVADVKATGTQQWSKILVPEG